MTEYNFFIAGYEKTPGAPTLWTAKASNAEAATFLAEMFRSHGLERVSWRNLEVPIANRR
jgi:hypothetical protein